jgi:hypothetical protein
VHTPSLKTKTIHQPEASTAAGNGPLHGFLKVNIQFASFIDGTRPDERRSVHHQGLFTPPLKLSSPLLA